MPREIGIGIIGFGWMGRAHSRSYLSVPLYFPDEGILPRLVGVADSVAERVQLAERDYGFEFGVSDWHSLLDRDDIEIIDITAPNVLHQEIAEAALAAGKNVFCEKPVGIGPSSTAAIARAGRAANAITGCGYNFRWAPLVQHTKELVESGRLGDITHYRGRFFSMYGQDRMGTLSWRFLQEEGGYGVLADIMSHAIDMAHYLCGPIKRLVATKETFVRQRPLPRPGEGTHYDKGSPDDPTGEVTNEDYVGALIEFESGARGTLEADRSMVGPQSQMAFELNGSAGAAAWDHEKLNQLRLYLKDESPTDGFVEVLAGDTFPHHGSLVPGGGNSIGFEDMKIIEILEYLKSVAAGRKHRPDFEDALAVANVQCAMIRSWENGTWEDVTPID